jgi:alkanesulfonate monooxygenase SsuD/methylene tetrahydromethanopterin reductase-like flavin-dependent oxidoreductase (luciferase family)
MRFGLNLPNGGPAADPRSLAELAALAEASGWDGVFLEDYIVYQNRADTPTYDPWVCLAAMAMRTERIRLGTTVTPLPRRRVAKLAAEAVALDHLSGGRLTLGIGLGDPWDVALANLGEQTDTATRAAMVDEGLDVLVGLWSGEPFTVHGRFYQAEGVRLLPEPLQTPRIPIWIGGQYPRPGPIRRAARWDGACLFIPTHYSAENISQRDWTPDDVRTLLQKVSAQRPHGIQGFDVVVGGRERLADWDAERSLIASLDKVGATWWNEWIAPAQRAAMEAAIARGPLLVPSRSSEQP